MAGQSGPAPPGQQPEPLIKPGADLRYRQRAQPRRGELDGQRDPVQAHADRRHRRGIGIIKGEALPVHRGVLGEQLHRLESGQPRGVGETGGRDSQRRNPEDMLPADAQRLPAGDQQARPRAGPYHGVGQLRGRAKHVLGVVEDDQQVPVADRVDQGIQHGPSRLLADTEHGGHGACDQLGVGHRRQLDQPHSVPGAIQYLGRHLQRQPGLADPARPGDRDQPTPPGHQRPQLSQLAGPAHETSRLRRQVMAQRRVIQRPQRAEPPGQARPGHLEHLLRAAQVLQAVLAQIRQPDPAGQPPGQQLKRRPGHQDLTAMPGRQEPGGPVHHRTEIITVALRAGARMQRHPHPDRQPRRPRFSADSPLDGHRARQRGGRISEHRTKRLADRLEDPTARTLDLLADHAVMAGRRLSHRLAIGLPQPDAALDIGEQQHHRARGKPHPLIVPPFRAFACLSDAIPASADVAPDVSREHNPNPQQKPHQQDRYRFIHPVG